MNPYYSRYYTFIKPIARNKTVQTYSSLGFSLILIIAFSVFAIKPTLSTIVALQKTINEQQKILDQLNTKAENLSEAKSNLDQINPQQMEKLNRLLPDRTDPTGIISNLSSVVAENQATMSAFQLESTELFGGPNSQTKQPPLEEVGFTASLDNTYFQSVSLLNLFDKSGRLFHIDGLNYARHDDGAVVLIINGKAYLVK